MAHLGVSWIESPSRIYVLKPYPLRIWLHFETGPLERLLN